MKKLLIPATLLLATTALAAYHILPAWPALQEERTLRAAALHMHREGTPTSQIPDALQRLHTLAHHLDMPLPQLWRTLEAWQPTLTHLEPHNRAIATLLLIGTHTPAHLTPTLQTWWTHTTTGIHLAQRDSIEIGAAYLTGAAPAAPPPIAPTGATGGPATWTQIATWHDTPRRPRFDPLTLNTGPIPVDPDADAIRLRIQFSPADIWGDHHAALAIHDHHGHLLREWSTDTAANTSLPLPTRPGYSLTLNASGPYTLTLEQSIPDHIHAHRATAAARAAQATQDTRDFAGYAPHTPPPTR